MTDLSPPRGNPYVGPRAFLTGEPLYGRDRELRQLLNLLVAERIVLLCSPSGAGKTSLIQAALIPRLNARNFQVRPIIRVNAELPVELRAVDPPASVPGRVLPASSTNEYDLLRELLGLPAEHGEPDITVSPYATQRLSTANRYTLSVLLSLEKELPDDQQLPLQELAELSIAEYLQRRAAASVGSAQPANSERPDEVLIFDQFEEILTVDPTDRAARQEFFLQLGRALEDPRRWALFAVREEYVAGLDPYLRPIPTQFSTIFRLDLLQVNDARTAIQRPAQIAGTPFTETAAIRLTDDLRRVQVQQADGTTVTQLGEYVEPVQLQVVCYRLWERLPAGTTQIVEADLAAVGDVDSALSSYYDERVAAIAATTSVAERAIRDWCEERLITEQDIRGQVLQGRERSGGLENRAVTELLDTHLVRGEKRRGATWYELAHDRLIAPIRKSNAAWRAAHLSLLQRQATLWDQQGRRDGLLLVDATLDDAERWAADHQDQLTDAERDFLEECRAAHQTLERERRKNRRIRRLFFAAAIFGVLAIILAAVSFYSFSRARAQEQVALARQLAAQSLNLGPNNLELALLLGQQAYSLDHDPETLGSLLAGVQQVSRLKGFMRGHTNEVWNVAFRPDGTLLASAGKDKTVRLWNPATLHPNGEPLTAHSDEVLSVAFSPDGTLLASGGKDKTIMLWDVATRKPAGQPIVGHKGWVIRVAFSPDGRTLASASEDTTIILWDVASRKPRGTPLHAGSGQVWGLAWSPDGKFLASGNQDGAIILWDVSTRKPIGDPLVNGEQEAGDWVRSVAFSPDGKTLAAGSAGEKRVRLWDIAKRQLVAQFTGHSNVVSSVAFSPDGKTLASGSLDNTIILWDIEQGHQRDIPLTGHLNWIWGVVFSPDGKTLASASVDQTVALWDLTRPSILSRPLLGHKDVVNKVAFSPDGRILASASDDKTIMLWDVAARKPFGKPLVGHTDAIGGLAFSPDGKTLASASNDKTIMLWDVAAHAPIGTPFVGHRRAVYRVIFSPDGKTLASAGCGVRPQGGNCVESEIRFWDVATHQQLGDPIIVSFKSVNSFIYSLAISPDGHALAAGVGDELIMLWSMDTRQLLDSPLKRHDGEVTALTFSPDSKTLVSGGTDHNIFLWDVATQQRRDPPLIGHELGVQGVAFSPDGALLASGGADSTITLWDMTGFQRLGRSLRGHTGAVMDVAFSPDGALLASGGEDGVVILWDLSVESWQKLACQIVGRKLTQGEWRQYLGDRTYQPTCADGPAADSTSATGATP